MRTIEFETPENVQISYQAAGLGARFIAWFVDQILVFFISILLVLALIFLLVAADVIGDSMSSLAERLESAENDPHAGEEIAKYMLGGMTIILGFTSIFYYGFSELFMRGQTLGKRWLGLRVVKANGFALDVGSVFVRNLFRPVDHLPPLWVTPVLSARGQRFGDMVAGTIVVADHPPPLNRVRIELSERPLAEARFRFEKSALASLSHDDYESLEQLLDRWDDIPQSQLEQLLQGLIQPLARRLKAEAPADPDRLQFLEDLMAAEYHRQSRSLI
jgi:uncharacterized RDD family membrane protein YckC